LSRTQRLVLVLVLNLGLVAGLVAVGITAHSLAVLAEGSDYLLDAAGIGVALLAIRLSARPARRGRPNSYRAATEIAALVNCGWLLILEMLVVTAAAYRLITHTPEVHGLPVLVVSAAAALIMTVGALVLRGDADDSEEEANERDLSVTAVLLDTVADAAAAAGVAATGVIILATGDWYWLDPAVALIIAVIIAYHALALLRRIRSTLQPATPTAN
jgi:cobalt-zinc-cadmium efflux system protein